jgi:cytochrome c oxidase assembly factor CtaG
MSSVSQAILSSWSVDPKIALGLTAALLLYWRGWFILHRALPERFSVWRFVAFAAGLATLWLAISSPLDAFSGLLLSAHMVQHLFAHVRRPTVDSAGRSPAASAAGAS